MVANNLHRSSVPRRRSFRIRGRTCRGQSNEADIGTPAGRPGYTFRPANLLCNSICQPRTRRARCSVDPNNQLQFVILVILHHLASALFSFFFNLSPLIDPAALFASCALSLVYPMYCRTCLRIFGKCHVHKKRKLQRKEAKRAAGENAIFDIPRVTWNWLKF